MNRKFALVFAVFLFLLSAAAFIRQSRQPERRQAGQKKIIGASSVSLFPHPIIIEGNKTLISDSVSFYNYDLEGKDILKLTYDLGGLCLLPGQSSALFFKSSDLTYSAEISLAEYGENCKTGEQSVDIPLTSFFQGKNRQPVNSLGYSFWYPTHFRIKLVRALLYNSGGAVLGIADESQKPVKSKTFPHITPLRPSPYAAYSDVEKHDK